MKNRGDLTKLNLSQVVAHARDLLGTLNGAMYKNAYDFVLREGEVFASGALTDTERRLVTKAMGRKQFPPKVCFFNAQRLVMADTSGELEYVEGYTTGLIHHAWVAAGPKVIDLTLQHVNGGRPILGALPVGREYFGVRFGRAFLAAALKRRRVVNFLDDWEADFPVLQGVRRLATAALERAQDFRNFETASGIRRMEAPASRRFLSMSNNNPSPISSFFSRVLANDATKRGVASAVAGVLVALATEALFPRS